MGALPQLLEAFRGGSPGDLRYLNLNALIKQLSMPVLTEIAPDLKREWTEEGNTVVFRILCLRLLARLTVFLSLTGKPVDGGFWESVLRSKHSSFRGAAILACNLATDDRLWHCMTLAWRNDPNALNRALALETMGTIVSRDRRRARSAMEEFHEAVARTDRWAKLGALYGSLFVKDATGDAVARKIVVEETDGYLVATAFAVLLKRKPKRMGKIFTATLGYILREQTSVKTATALLGVCRLCNPEATRRVCLRAMERPAHGRMRILRAAAMNMTLAGVFGLHRIDLGAMEKEIKKRSPGSGPHGA